MYTWQSCITPVSLNLVPATSRDVKEGLSFRIAAKRGTEASPMALSLSVRPEQRECVRVLESV